MKLWFDAIKFTCKLSVICAIKVELLCFHIRVLPHGSFPDVFAANFYQETERNRKVIYQSGKHITEYEFCYFVRRWKKETRSQAY
jgi:hypothetical protein